MIRLLAVVIAVLALAACGGGSKSSSSSGLPQGTTSVKLDPADFTTNIDNPYWPMHPGDHWVYREVEDGEVHRDDVTVTNRTKTLGGIEARVVHDRVSQNGETLEETDDWYAQDSKGNLWYLGEDTAEYENGKLKTKAGSWAYGVDGAEPGVIVPASPEQGMKYREEYYAGHAEDAAEVLSVGQPGAGAVRSVPGRAADEELLRHRTDGRGDEALREGGRPGDGAARVGRIGPHGAAELLAVDREVLVGEEDERNPFDSGMAFELCTDRSECDLGGRLGRIAEDARRDRRERDRAATELGGDLERPAVTRSQKLGLVRSAALPDRPDGMDHVARG